MKKSITCQESQELILKQRYCDLLHQKKEYLLSHKLECFKPYGWQVKFWSAGRKYRQRMLMAANQIGKTDTGCMEVAYHLTGNYPESWEGHRFNFPPKVLAMGVSTEQLKKVLQPKLLGDFVEERKLKYGLIPSDLLNCASIVYAKYKNAVKEVKVQHRSGGLSDLSFMSYSQGQDPLMGPIYDFIIVDEEPRDPEIFPQLLTRTTNGDRGRGGHIVLTLTPEHGVTQLIYSFTEELKSAQYLQNNTWDDAPHLTEKKKQELLESYPPYQRAMRSQGIPMLGAGAIYPISDDVLYDDCQEMLSHWRRLNAIDFGTSVCGLVFGAYDADADCLHIYEAIKIRDQLPAEIALTMRSRGDWIPWVYPHDGHLPDRSTGEQQKVLYENEGVTMVETHAQFETGGFSREAGIMRILHRMRSRKLRVSRHLTDFFTEKRLYHRKEGKIVKENDHLLDALRYLEMMLRYSKTKEENENYILQPRNLSSSYYY